MDRRQFLELSVAILSGGTLSNCGKPSDSGQASTNSTAGPTTTETLGRSIDLGKTFDRGQLESALQKSADDLGYHWSVQDKSEEKYDLGLKQSRMYEHTDARVYNNTIEIEITYYLQRREHRSIFDSNGVTDKIHVFYKTNNQPEVSKYLNAVSQNLPK